MSKVLKCGKGYRFEENGWIYMHAEGTPLEIGYQHGYLLGKEIIEVIENIKRLTMITTGKTWEFFVAEGKRQFAPKLSKEYLDELRGISKGVRKHGGNVSVDELITWNGYEELRDFWFPTVSDYTTSETSHGRCSAFIATGSATADGGIVLAHNTWESFLTGQYLNVIMDLVPIKGNRILMQSAPGYISSFSDFFVNSSGIMGADTSISNFKMYDESGTPQFYRIRKAIQYAKTMEGFVKIMSRHSNGGYTSSWLLGDLNTSEIMRFEQGLEYRSVKKIKDGWFIGYNAPVDPRIRNLECGDTGYDDIRNHTGARRVRLTQLMTLYEGTLNVELAKAILADHYDVYTQEFQPSSRTVDGHYELDPQPYSGLSGPKPFEPEGALDGKVMDTSMGANMMFDARWGNSSGLPFDATVYLSEHIQFSQFNGLLKDRPKQPYTIFTINQKPPIM